MYRVNFHDVEPNSPEYFEYLKVQNLPIRHGGWLIWIFNTFHWFRCCSVQDKTKFGEM